MFCLLCCTAVNQRANKNIPSLSLSILFTLNFALLTVDHRRPVLVHTWCISGRSSRGGRRAVAGPPHRIWRASHSFCHLTQPDHCRPVSWLIHYVNFLNIRDKGTTQSPRKGKRKIDLKLFLPPYSIYLWHHSAMKVVMFFFSRPSVLVRLAVWAHCLL